MKRNGKAGNLAILSMIRGINVPKFVVLRPNMSEDEQIKIIRNFLKKNCGNTVAVRSSAGQEDSENASFAGMYATKLRVPATMSDIQVAIDEVRASASQKKETVLQYTTHLSVKHGNVDMSVIVQEMIEADISGVIFSHSIDAIDGYYVVSITNGIGKNVVSGIANGKLIRIARGVKPASIKDSLLRKLIIAMKSIEKRFKSSSLDVEFAVQGNTLYILQCRPITTIKTRRGKILEEKIIKRVESLNTRISSRFRGDVLGDMIDINPVELLGTAPTPLDISIFKYLFADKIVEQVRRDMGYNPLDVGLLRIVEGKPYISMRASAFSFRPQGISYEIYERMVNVYRNTLIENPALQSRVEFDLFAMSHGEKLEQVIQEARLNDDEKSIVREAFLHIDTAFSQVSTKYAKTFDAFASNYEQHTASIDNASLKTILEHVARGTKMFVRVARLAFYWKNKFEEIHPQEDINELIGGYIQSVSGQLQADLVACRNGKISRDKLVRQYGHLRPGQFSVFGESYADDPDTYLFAQMNSVKPTETSKRAYAFENTTEFKNVITFMQARERMKFLFSQSLYLFTTKLRRQLAQRDISEGDASCVSWNELNAYLNGLSPFKVNRGKDKPHILLPNVIIPEITDLRVIAFNEAMPSYITNSIVKARACVLERLGVKADVKGAIVVLPNADPGYDFLFHSGAVGIITKVGGPASHMCIRSTELQMPVCIGCGESVYQKLTTAHSAVLDCRKGQIIVLEK